jgi:hypothetical protein
MKMTSAMTTANPKITPRHRGIRRPLTINARAAGTRSRLTYPATWTTNENVAAEASKRPGR